MLQLVSAAFGHLSLYLCWSSPLHLLFTLPSGEDSSEMLQCAFVQADWSQVSHPVLMYLVLQPWPYWLSFTGLAHYVHVFLGLAAPPGHSPPDLLVPNRGRTTWINLLATLLLEQTNVLMVFIVLLTKTPKCFLAKLPFSYYFLYLPILCYCLVLLHLHWKIWHLASMHFIRFLPDLFSKLLESLHSSSTCSTLTQFDHLCIYWESSVSFMGSDGPSTSL